MNFYPRASAAIDFGLAASASLTSSKSAGSRVRSNSAGEDDRGSRPVLIRLDA
jgi:hypothetical protein